MHEEQNAAREPEIFREQQTLTARLEVMDKCADELRGEIGQLENTLRIALRPAQDKPQPERAAQPEHPMCLTPMGGNIRSASDQAQSIARQLSGLTERLRDLRERCELPRLPEEARSSVGGNALIEPYPGTPDRKY